MKRQHGSLGEKWKLLGIYRQLWETEVLEINLVPPSGELCPSPWLTPWLTPWRPCPWWADSLDTPWWADSPSSGMMQLACASCIARDMAVQPSRLCEFTFALQTHEKTMNLPMGGRGGGEVGVRCSAVQPSRL